ncbi:MAG: phospho-sugar mutase [Planctomycetota bacterium]
MTGKAVATTDLAAISAQLDAAASAGHLTALAVANIRDWLTQPRYASYAAQVIEHIQNGKWRELDDAFWTVIPFGTGGRRGRMYPIGSNAINDRTIGESAQGLADYVRAFTQQSGAAGAAPLACAIAYDTRNNSRHFAELCAGIMVANGFQVFFLDDYRSTPELSFLVRYKNCACGIKVTASHNPPSDNAVKVYWSTGGQILPPHDRGIIDRVMNTDAIQQVDFATALKDGRVTICTAEVDAAFLSALQSARFPGPRNLKIIYTPLHGVGASAVLPALAADGFQEVELYGPHAEPNGNFPNVPGHVSNPENPQVFAHPIQHAMSTGAELILATDPDCDRMGCAAPLTTAPSSPWMTLNGNQIGALLTDFVLEQRGQGRRLTSDYYVVKTLVTTDMVKRIADSYGVRTVGDLHVGFKYIGGAMDEQGADRFLFGTEESHGYLVGQYARDKDGAVACMLMAELAAAVKAKGQTIHQKLDSLYWQHGYHAEKLLNLTMEGSQGMVRMKALMQQLRTAPPQTLGGLPVVAVRDYLHSTRTVLTKQPEPMAAPKGDMIVLELGEEGNYIAVRPSGTEPKVKFYMFSFVAAEQLHHLERTKHEISDRLSHIESDLRQLGA